LVKAHQRRLHVRAHLVAQGDKAAALAGRGIKIGAEVAKRSKIC
jgi:hypothetical protein